MTIPVWPTGLPYDPILDTLRIARLDARKTTDMEAGPPKSQLRSAMRRQKEYQWETDYSRDEVETLDQFYEDDICEGSRPFTFPADPLHGDACMMKFISPPSYAPSGAYDDAEPRWRATIHVRRMPA